MENKFKSKVNRIALVVGLFFAVLYIIWFFLVAFDEIAGINVGQTIIGWIFPLRLIDNLYYMAPSATSITGSEFINTLLFVASAFLTGYILTLLFIGLLRWMKVIGYKNKTIHNK